MLGDGGLRAVGGGGLGTRGDRERGGIMKEMDCCVKAKA